MAETRFTGGAQLRIVAHSGAADSAAISAEPGSAVERVFAHWVFMLNKRRAALGPVRRRVIERALVLYEEEVLLLAIEGGAASRWHAGENDRGRVFDDIELWLRDEAHIERFADDGEALRTRAARDAARALREAAAREERAASPQADSAAATLAKERLRELAARMRRGR